MRGAACCVAVDIKAVVNLDGQLAGWGDNEYACGPVLDPHGVLCHSLDEGEGEGGGLAGARLGEAQEVAACQEGRDGHGLDGGGGGVALGFHCLEEGFVEPE